MTLKLCYLKLAFGRSRFSFMTCLKPSTAFSVLQRAMPQDKVLSVDEFRIRKQKETEVVNVHEDDA